MAESERGAQDSHETHAVRFSARLTPKNAGKLVEIAKERGWLNAKGMPNLSRVVNWIIEQYVSAEEKRNVRRE